jgi:hypothetical protein
VRFNNGQVVNVGINIYQVTTLAPETEYTWAVQAVKGDVLSPWSANAFFTTLPTIIEVPMNFTVSDITYESAVLSWDGVEGATGYEVRVGDTASVVVEELTYALTALDPETEYVCSVRTMKDNKVSEWATVTFITLPLPPVGIPENLVATDITCYSAVLSWNAVERATGYRVSINGREFSVNDPTYTVIALHPETEYAWTVRALEGTRLGDWASGVSLTTTAEPTIVFTVPYSTNFYGEYFGPGTSNFTLTFRTNSPLSNVGVGGLEMVSPPVDMRPS